MKKILIAFKMADGRRYMAYGKCALQGLDMRRAGAPYAVRRVLPAALLALILSTFYLLPAHAQDSGALSLLYAAPVTAAACTGGTVTLTVPSGTMPGNMVNGIYVDVGGSSVAAWNSIPTNATAGNPTGGGFGPITVSGQNISYSEACSAFPSYAGGAYVAAQIPSVGAYAVVNVPGHLRLALGDQSYDCGNNSCVYGMGLSDLWDNKNDTEDDITSWTASGTSVTLTLANNPPSGWASPANQPICLFESSLSSGTLSPTGSSINGCFLISSISTNQVSYTLTGGVSCSSTCSGQGGFVYQVDMGSMDAGLAQLQFGVINAPLALSSTPGAGASVTGTCCGGDGKTVTLTLANSAITPTVAAGSVNVYVQNVSIDSGSCTFNTSANGLTVTAVSAGQLQYQLGTAQVNSCTGHGGTAQAGRWFEYKNSSGAQISVLEANNVRVRLKETWGLRQYGQFATYQTMPNYTNGLDCCVTGTEYYTIYRPDKIFHRWDMTYTNADSQAPLTFGGIGSGGSDATTQLEVLKTQNDANNKTQADAGPCTYYEPLSVPWEQVWQTGYLSHAQFDTWIMFTPNHASWYGTVTLTNGSTAVSLASGDNFAAGMPLTTWVNAQLFVWPTGGQAQQLTVASVTGSDFTGGTALTLTSAFSGASGTYNYYAGAMQPWDFGNSSNCGPSGISATGVLTPVAGDVQTCATGPTGGASGCQSPYTYGTKLSGAVHSNYLRVLGASPLSSPALAGYQANNLSGPQWFEGMRVRLQAAYSGVSLPGDGNPHTILYDMLRLGDNGLWQSSATYPRSATQAVAGDYAAEYEVPPAPSFTTGSCTSGYGTSCFDQDTGAYQITASGGAVNLSLSLPSWQSNHTYSIGQAIWDGTNVEVATFGSAGGGPAASGASGGTQPNWSSNCPSEGNICADNNVTWLNAGNRYFHYPAFEVAGWSSVPSTLTVNSHSYALNTDYVGAVNAGGVVIQLLTGDSGTPGFYASGLQMNGKQGVAGLSGTGGSGASVMACAGGPPNYCARTDLNVQAESALPFTVGSFTDGSGIGVGYNDFPANTIFTDPDFGERIVRATDNNTLSSVSCFNQGSAGNTNLMDGNENANVFSSDSHWFKVGDLNGNAWLFSFNPATMQATCKPVSSTYAGQLPFSASAQFGLAVADAGLYFGTPIGSGWAPEIQTYNVTNGAYTTIVDFRTCSGLSWLSSLPRQSIGWMPTPGLSVDDNYISEAFGPSQNEGWLNTVYQQSTGKCGWLDSRTGQIGGNLWPGVTQMTGVLPLNFGVNGGPSVPTATATTGGSLTTGHQYAIQYSLVWETPQNGKGETAASMVQYVTLSGAQNAVSLPSPAASANDSLPWSHYNIYACDNTASRGCAPTLQPAANLGCSMATPTLTVTPNTTGSTSYTYIEEAVGDTCNTWDVVTISNGNATPNNTLTPGSVSGAYFYRVIKGPWTNAGTATVDQGIYPGDLNYAWSASGADVTDTGQSPALSAVGTMSCNASYIWMPTQGLPYTCNNNATLTALTAGGPAPPTTSTVGIFMHASQLSQDGNWIVWGQVGLQGSVFWNLGTSSSLFCNTNAAWENPPNSYTACAGHAVFGKTGFMSNGNGMGDPGYFYEQSYRPNSGILTQDTDVQCTTAPTQTCEMIVNFPAKGSFYPSLDQHQSWWNNHGHFPSPMIWSNDAASGGRAPQTPVSIDRGWAREVDATNPVTGIVYRFAHHRTTGVAYYIADCSTSPGCESAFYHCSSAVVSDDGKWAVFTSDMDWMLGCRPNVTCTYNSNGQVISGESRADVFIVELK